MMMYMKTVYKWLLSMVVVFGMTACDELQNPDIDDMLSSDGSEENIGDALKFSDLTFSDDYKVMELSARLMHDVGDYDLMDSLRVSVRSLQQVQILAGKFGDESQPVITKVTNPSRETLKTVDLKLLLLVDLSLPQQQIDAELNAVREIRALFGHQGIYLAFMQGDNVSETYEATDYVLDNYFVHHDPSYVYLFRSVLTKLAEFTDISTTIGSANHKVLIIMSGGKTYENDIPVDPKHFALQQLLANKTIELKDQLLAYYVNFSSVTANGDELFALSDNTRDANILQYFCKNLNGLYQPSFNWQEMESAMLKDFHIDPSVFHITLENPDGKIYRGNLHKLQVGFYDKNNNDLVAKGSTTFSLGTAYNPIIINGISMTEVVIRGILITLFVFLVVWIIMQFIEPYIRYRIFKHKYIIRYSGKKMSFEGQTVAESCYLCKGAFETGDEIVVKCKHTMHKSCWDENEYHCPEHGRHCKEGSHYYNQNNRYDSRNTLFYTKWVLVAIVAGFSAWWLFIAHDQSLSMSIIDYMHKIYHNVTSTAEDEGHMTTVYGSYMCDLPAFGLTVASMLTFFLSYFTVNRRMWVLRLAEMLFRAFLAGIVGCLCCLLGCLLSIILHLESATFLIDWIPWVLLSYVIMLAVTIKTHTPIRKSFFFYACGIAVIFMLTWGFVFYNSLLSYRLSLLMGFIAYTVALAVCIAKAAPRSERYFLHVNGAIKEMDIALYKWIKNDPDRVVSIGKSVDCSIQLSWDINGQVAPVQAEIRKYVHSLRLTALEDGVLVKDKPLKPGREIWLYHGRQFTIGNTTFTYIEKDL